MELWNPSEETIINSNLFKFEQWLKQNKDLSFTGNPSERYKALWQWSVENVADFWESIWHFFDIQAHSNYEFILQKPAIGFIGTQWFGGSTLSYAEHIFRHQTEQFPALIFQSETQQSIEISWQELSQKVNALRLYLLKSGIQKGDRVVGYLSNTPETIISFLAVNSLGGIWSCCSPDFGVDSIIDRFQQIEPKVLIATKGYSYNGKHFDKSLIVNSLNEKLPSLKETIIIESDVWNDIMRMESDLPLSFVPVEFDHPIWILYSSGTTGKPKAITHGTGACILEHLKAIALHQDCKTGERFLWYSTTGWMMWNYALSSLMTGCTLCIFEGSPTFPNLDVFWDFARSSKVNHFGCGAAFYINYLKNTPSKNEALLGWDELRTIGSTGSPLPAEGFQWIYENVKKDVHLISFSGGTDVCSAFVGGCIYLPVYAGEIQCRMLGAAIEAWNDKGKAVLEEVGELMITEPMPSMPVFFWNDDDNLRYKSSYYEKNVNVWCHGDWIKITEHAGVIIYGRSDATLNRDGVRIGTAEIYSAVESLPEIKDSLVVCLEQKNGSFFMPLFIQTIDNKDITNDLMLKIKQTLRQKYSPRHVPDAIYLVPEIPYTMSGKKMEMPVKKVLMGVPLTKAVTLDAMRNPSSIDFFVGLKFSNEPF